MKICNDGDSQTRDSYFCALPQPCPQLSVTGRAALRLECIKYGSRDQKDQQKGQCACEQALEYEGRSHDDNDSNRLHDKIGTRGQVDATHRQHPWINEAVRSGSRPREAENGDEMRSGIPLRPEHEPENLKWIKCCHSIERPREDGEIGNTHNVLRIHCLALAVRL